MEYLYVFEGRGAKKNLLRNFQIKNGDCGDWTNKKAAGNCYESRRSGSIESAQNLSCFSIQFCNLCINWILYEKNTSFGCTFSQLQCYQILLKSVNIWPSNHKVIKRANIFTARSSNENSVCLSVCLSNAWFVTKRKKVVPAFLYCMKDHLL